MDGELLIVRSVHPDEQVFSSGDDFVHCPAGEVKGGEPGHAEVGGGELLPGQGLVQLPGGPPDGIALRHGFLPQARILSPLGVE